MSRGADAVKRRWLLAVGALVFVASGIGCKGTAGPSWFHPGSAGVQQSRALRFDPYPENDIGPNVDGARPRGYEKPPPEPSRARWTIGGWGQ
jgi:hypothetical protein